MWWNIWHSNIFQWNYIQVQVFWTDSYYCSPTDVSNKEQTDCEQLCVDGLGKPLRNIAFSLTHKLSPIWNSNCFEALQFVPQIDRLNFACHYVQTSPYFLAIYPTIELWAHYIPTISCIHIRICIYIYIWLSPATPPPTSWSWYGRGMVANGVCQG